MMAAPNKCGAGALCPRSNPDDSFGSYTSHLSDFGFKRNKAMMIVGAIGHDCTCNDAIQVVFSQTISVCHMRPFCITSANQTSIPPSMLYLSRTLPAITGEV